MKQLKADVVCPELNALGAVADSASPCRATCSGDRSVLRCLTAPQSCDSFNAVRIEPRYSARML
jgi:hypothetical protein